MAKRIVSLLFTALVATTVFAETVYLSARMSPLFAEASTGAARNGVLRQGDALDVLSTDGDWLGVRTEAGDEGFVQRMFVADESPTGAVSRSSGLQDISGVASRRRASAYSTSAAATRGLSADNPRDRENLSFDEYDFRAVEWVRGFTFSEEEVLDFAAQQGIGI